MRTIINQVIIKVSAETDNVIEHNIVDDQGQKLHLIRPTFTGDSDSLKMNRIYGQVVSIPDKLEGLEPYFRNYPGFPPPAPYRTSDNLARSLTRNHQRKLTDEEKARVHNFYNCTPYSDTYVRPTNIDIEVGDKVYFHYLTICDQNYMGKDSDGMKLFRVSYDKIICKVLDGDIIPVNGFILVEPFFGEGYVDIEIENRKIRGRMTQSGIVTETKERPEPLQGVLRYRSINSDIGGQMRWDTFIGDRILFLGAAHVSPNAKEFENKIEGSVYNTVREWDIVAFWDKTFNKFVPDGDYVKIKPVHHNESTSIIIPEKYRIPAEMGVVEDCGRLISAYELQDEKVHFNRKSLFNIEHDGYIYVRYADITMVTDHDVKLIGKQREKYRTYKGPLNY